MLLIKVTLLTYAIKFSSYKYKKASLSINGSWVCEWSVGSTAPHFGSSHQQNKDVLLHCSCLSRFFKVFISILNVLFTVVNLWSTLYSVFWMSDLVHTTQSWKTSTGSTHPGVWQLSFMGKLLRPNFYLDSYACTRVWIKLDSRSIQFWKMNTCSHLKNSKWTNLKTKWHLKNM